MKKPRVEMLDYQVAEMVGYYMRYTGRFNLKKDLLDRMFHKNDPELYNAMMDLLATYINELQRLRVVGLLKYPVNNKTIESYLWGVDEYGASINPRWISDFDALMEKYNVKESE